MKKNEAFHPIEWKRFVNTPGLRNQMLVATHPSFSLVGIIINPQGPAHLLPYPFG
jgi:hypothetical protein